MILTETITGDTASAVTLLTLCDAATGAAVPLDPALPQTFTDAAGGVWTFTFTEPSAWLTYRYTYQITWPDGTTTQLEGVSHSTSSAATGRYATQADIEALFGAQNVALWADLDNTQDALAMAARVAAALVHADDTIDNLFRGGAYAVPLVLHTGLATLTHWAAVLAGNWLYTNRGQRDDDKNGNRYQAMLAGIMSEMREYKTGQSGRLDAESPLVGVPQPQGPVVM